MQDQDYSQQTTGGSQPLPPQQTPQPSGVAQSHSVPPTPGAATPAPAWGQDMGVASGGMPPVAGGQQPMGDDMMGMPGMGPGGFPSAMQGGMGGAAPEPKPEDTTPANFQLGALLPAELNVPVLPHSLQFDEKKFIRLLAGSISLSRDEKKRIIDTIPKLRQSQIDELIRIFEEEREKFAQLSKKHVPQLEKLAKQHAQDWIDLEAGYKAEAKKSQDDAAADEIRKSLGI